MHSPATRPMFPRSPRRAALLLGLFLLLGGASRGDAPKRPPLAEKYRQWLELVEYIITPDERRIFIDLDNDRDREAFINIFWNQRDPSRGTPANEFKDEQSFFRTIIKHSVVDSKTGFNMAAPSGKNFLDVNSCIFPVSN